MATDVFNMAKCTTPAARPTGRLQPLEDGSRSGRTRDEEVRICP